MLEKAGIKMIILQGQCSKTVLKLANNLAWNFKNKFQTNFNQNDKNSENVFELFPAKIKKKNWHRSYL
jgi:hypothetical protein